MNRRAFVPLLAVAAAGISAAAEPPPTTLLYLYDKGRVRSVVQATPAAANCSLFSPADRPTRPDHN